MERWYDKSVNDLRWDDLCTKAATGQCALCDALAERTRFERRWFKGGWFYEVKNAVVPSLKKGLSWLLERKLSTCLVLVGLAFLGWLIHESWLEIDPEITCPPLPEKLTSYLEIQLREQHPIEPTFIGELFFRSFNPIDAGVAAVAVQISKGRTYLPTVHNMKTTWNKNEKHLSSNDEKVGLVPTARSHKYFPFDSGRFDFEIKTQPPLDFGLVRIVNRVPGFLMHCSELHVDRPNTGLLHIQFVLHRSPLVQLFVTTFVVVSAAFLVLILRITQFTSLAASMATFFLSLWSLRRILETQMKTFPTLFDCAILVICVAALLCVCWKAYALSRPASGV